MITKAEAILAENEAEDAQELFAIENSLHELRTCSQALNTGHVPEFCYTRQSPRANELSRKSRSFWELKGQDEQCLKTPCSRKSHKITTKVNKRQFFHFYTYIPPYYPICTHIYGI